VLQKTGKEKSKGRNRPGGDKSGTVAITRGQSLSAMLCASSGVPSARRRLSLVAVEQ